MKFELFGKLRDNDSSGNNTSRQSPPSPNTGGGLDMSSGDGLDRTVENMFSQGYTEGEIKDELQGEYPPSQIENAINNAVASSATGNSQNSGPEAMTAYQGDESPVSPMDEGFSGNDEPQNDPPGFNDNQTQQPPMNQQPSRQPEPIQNDNNTEAQDQGDYDPRTEELVETIVAENIDRIESEFENVYTEIDEMQEKIKDLEGRVHDLEVRDDEDQEQFVQKVDEMEDHIDQYQSRIGGLEKAFQQVLPSLVDNVRDLTDLVQEMKQEKGIDTEKNVSKQDIDDIDMEDWD